MRETRRLLPPALLFVLTGSLAGQTVPLDVTFGYRFVKVDGSRLSVVGLDCLDGTPLIDIKPYFASTDSVPDASVGWHAARKR